MCHRYELHTSFSPLVNELFIVLAQPDYSMPSDRSMSRRIFYRFPIRFCEYSLTCAYLYIIIRHYTGRWSLSPTFDVTYSYNPVSVWTARQQMTINGKTDGFSMNDLNACAKSASMKRGRAATIVGQVIEIVSRWHEHRGHRG